MPTIFLPPLSFFLFFCGGSIKFELSTLLNEGLFAQVKIVESDASTSTLPTAVPPGVPRTGVASGTVDRGRKAVDGAIELTIFTFLGKIHVCVSKGLPITSLWNVFAALAAGISIVYRPVSNQKN